MTAQKNPREYLTHSKVIQATDLWYKGQARSGPELYMGLSGISETLGTTLATALWYVTGKRSKYARKRRGSQDAVKIIKRWGSVIRGRWKELEKLAKSGELPMSELVIKPATLPPASTNGHGLLPDDRAALERLIASLRETRLNPALASVRHWESVIASLESARELLVQEPAT